ncbi:MAG TPA: MFS transporter [Pseudonocardiaceae bacterium]
MAAGLANLLFVEAPRPRRIREYRYASWLAVGTVCFGAFLGQLDASIVTLIFPALRTEFHAPLASVEWVSLSYLLVLVALLAPVGRLSDAVGRKQYYLYGFALFTVASAACGAAPNLITLICLRIVQAGGAALLQANSVALVTTSVPTRLMRSALGVQAAAQALGLALGPTIGGLLVDSTGWRWVFWVNVPVGVAGLILGRYLLPRTRARTPVPSFDWPGVALLAGCTTALLLVISSASGLSLPFGAAVALAVVSVLAGVAFVWRQRRARSPLVDLRLLRTRAVAGGLAAALGGYLILFGPLVLVPVVFGAGDAGGVMRAGLVVTALPAGFGLAAVFGARLLPRHWSHRARCLVGAVLCVVALAGQTVALALLPRSLAISPESLVPGLAVLGIGLGLFTPANNAMVMGAIPPGSSGMGGGLVNMGRGLGTSLGVAVVTLTLHVTGGGLGGAQWVLGLLGVVAVLVAATAWHSGGGQPASTAATWSGDSGSPSADPQA